MLKLFLNIEQNVETKKYILFKNLRTKIVIYMCVRTKNIIDV
jgi:hypothetical protein